MTMTGALPPLPWPLLAVSLLLLTASSGQGEDSGHSCVLPYPSTILGSTRGGPAQELSRSAAGDYRDCTGRCCLQEKGRCNIVLYSAPPADAGSSAEAICSLFHCQDLANCTIRTATPGDQVFADAHFVRQLLAANDTTNDHVKEQSSTTKESTPKNDSDVHESNHKSTLPPTKKPKNTDEPIPENAGGTKSTTSTPREDLYSPGGGVQEEAQDSGGSSTPESNATKSVFTQTEVTNKNVSVSPVAGTKKPQSGSGKNEETPTETPSSAESQQSSTTGPSGTDTGAGKTHEAAESNNTVTGGVQSSPGQSGTNSSMKHTAQPDSAKPTTTMPKSLNNSDEGSLSHSSSGVAPKAGSSGGTSALSVIHTTPQLAGENQTQPSSNSTEKSDQNGSTRKPSGSTPTATVTPNTQMETKATTHAVRSGWSDQQNLTSPAKTRPTQGPSSIHNATTSSETSATDSSGTAPSSENDVTNGSSGMAGNSSAGSRESSEATTALTGGKVTNMAGSEQATSLHNLTTPVDTSLAQGSLTNGTNQTSAWTHVTSEQTVTTMAVLITALTLGCIFLLVTLILVGKRLLDCWKNRQYAQINRDYLIDGMYDE